MIKYTIGDIIRLERKKQKISQETLCDGICTPSWLSKIESGACTPTPTLFEALMQRLGKNHSHYVTYLSEQDMQIEHIKIEIRRSISTGDNNKAIEYLEQLKTLARSDNSTDQQYILLNEIILNQRTDLSHAEALDLLFEALHLTQSHFQIEKIEDYLLSQEEIVIINNIAIKLNETDHVESSIDTLTRLKSYIENPRFDYEERLRTYSLICVNLAKWQKQKSDFIGCLNTTETAINFCVKYGQLSSFPELLFYKGCAFMGLLAQPAAIQCFKEAYFIFTASKNQSYAQHVIDYLKTEYKLDLF